MRPPDLPGGNKRVWRLVGHRHDCFNEAAGFTRRKPRSSDPVGDDGRRGFNEAAGFTRRKRRILVGAQALGGHASMRPPDLPGGNPSMEAKCT